MSEHAPTLPENVATAAPQTPAKPGERTAGGQFAQGNKCGRGNPFARQSALLRVALISAVTPADFAAIAKALVEKAKEGNVAAARLVISYTLGKPTPAAELDNLGQTEFEPSMIPALDMAPTGQQTASGEAAKHQAQDPRPSGLDERRGQVVSVNALFKSRPAVQHPSKHKKRKHHGRPKLPCPGLGPSTNGPNGAPANQT
jgi:hypothetical protein